MREELKRIVKLIESDDEEKSDDGETKEPVSCGIYLINTPKTVSTSCRHCAFNVCTKRLDKCHMCRKTILQKKKIFLC